MTAPFILHIVPRSAWETAQSAGSYRGDTLDTEGFIHCSTVAQVLGPANIRFHGQQDLLLLRIDAGKVRSEIIYEDCYDSGDVFPHIYGLLNLDAVTEVIDFPPNQDGSFSLPSSLRG
ncbi:DUF952 domain-containing protein [Candidatus Entotheonella palauensis]|uniref:Glutathione S-transferase n=1 Tax=Candidatus Entotheonella gemina TaxID=1429439 RepID=W4LUV5_9BACT|nr:DUF952 domain-containing protein [Candidatus Entotheonella palauensis]ETX01232.1 MAG: hypothetical protein ETSY2_37615 [Candidatus Entotheonella gemina]